jgi:hypothetical protein
MVVNNIQLYDEIKDFIASKGEPFSRWYVGSTEDVYRCLFVEHKVSESTDCWIYKPCQNSRIAKHLKITLMKLGCDGWSGGWAESAITVYAYLKNSHTMP